MNERVKILRKELGLTLEKFGGRLGVSKVAISNIENGNRNLTEQMKKSICREFNVDYLWLTTGEGEMFQEVDEKDEIQNLVFSVLGGDYPNLQAALVEFAKKATVDDLKNLDEFLGRKL